MVINGQYKILLVDDSEGTLEILSAILRRGFYNISTSPSGEEALEMLESDNYDLVLLDVKMPGMNGFQVCKAITENEKTREIPVIFISQLDDAEKIAEGFRVGGRDYVRKNASPVELLARVKTQLELHASRKKLRSTNRELLAVVEELRRANHQKREFLGMAAHGLKNRLTSVMGYAEFVRLKYGKNELLRKKLRKIEDASDKMLSLITSLLDNAANESGVRELKTTPADITELTHLVVESNREYSMRKGQEIILGGEKQCCVNGDKLILQEIIDNLLNNAIKYSPLGKSIWVTVSKNESFVTIEVRDEGQGFTEEDKTQLFGKFRKLSAKPTGGESSTGLGLALTRDYVELHGGAIRVQSQKGKGTTFTVELPVNYC
ncbi:MAG: hybrid sensor histidine kinase/response regulator [bacterium]|nr:hybrid sensor histidine kinase/response regulator [bacterium]